jgi:predicted RecA/RadA family phage recombinase
VGLDGKFVCVYAQDKRAAPGIKVLDLTVCPLPKALRVSITTDKTEYWHGENLQTSLDNGSRSSIYIDTWKRGWAIFQNKDGQWKEIFSGGSKGIPVCICGRYPGDICPLWEMPEEKYDEIKSGKGIYWSWDQKILQDTEKGCFNWIDAPAGKYKVELKYFETLDLSKREWKTVYSNEFIIKEERTADWKIYRNEKYGFEIMYPENFPASIGVCSTFYWSSLDNNCIRFMYEKNNECAFYIGEINKETNDNLLKDSEISVKELITINNINITMIMGGWNGQGPAYLFTKDNKYFVMNEVSPHVSPHSGLYWPLPPSCPDIHQMPSTFRFLD